MGNMIIDIGGGTTENTPTETTMASAKARPARISQRKGLRLRGGVVFFAVLRMVFLAMKFRRTTLDQGQPGPIRRRRGPTRGLWRLQPPPPQAGAK